MPELTAAPGSRQYRVLAPGDAALMAELQAASFAGGQPWDAKAMADLLAMPGAFGFIADWQGRPRGYLLARLAAAEAEIISLAVHPAARRQGLARGLLALLVRQTAALGGARIFLEVAETNGPARALYDLSAFREVARRPGYYRDNDGAAVAAVVMAYNIEPPKS